MEIGIIGAGWWAAHAYIPLLQANAAVDAIAVCRPDQEGLDRIAAELGIEHGYTEAGAMLEARDLAGVMVTSPHVVHAEHALMCIERGLPVLIEKPMTTTPDDAQRIVAAARTSGSPVMVAYGWNYRPLAAAARRLMDEGWIGDLLHATCLTASSTRELFSGEPPPPTASHLFRPPASTWADPGRAGGYAWGQLTHALGLFFLLVEHAPVGAFARMGLSDVGVDLNDAAVLELDNGATVSVSGSAMLPRGRSKQVDIRLFGTEGALFLDLERERLEATRFDGRSHVETVTAGVGQYGVDDLVAAFVDICAGKQVANLSDAPVGARTDSAIAAMYRSARTGAFEPV